MCVCASGGLIIPSEMTDCHFMQTIQYTTCTCSLDAHRQRYIKGHRKFESVPVLVFLFVLFVPNAHSFSFANALEAGE